MQHAPKSESVKNLGRFATAEIAWWPKCPSSHDGADLHGAVCSLGSDERVCLRLLMWTLTN